MDQNRENKLTVVIREKDRVIRSETARAVSSMNDKGAFDILPLHVNFVSLIRDFLIIHKEGGQKEEMKIRAALMHVFKNKVSVYLGLRNRKLSPEERAI